MFYVVFLVIIIILLIISCFVTYRKSKQVDWMILGTWVIAIVAISTTVISAYFYNKQLREMEKSRRFDWRPFLDIEHTNKVQILLYQLNPNAKIVSSITVPQLKPADADISFVEEIMKDLKEKSDSILVKSANDLKITDNEFNKVEYFIFGHGRRIIYSNVGNTPLRIKGSALTLMTKREWEVKYNKSTELLTKKLHDFDEWSLWDVDYVIKQDCIDTSSLFRIPKKIAKADFWDNMENDSTMVFYWVTYLEYQDFFGNEYNTLYIEYDIYKASVSNGFFNISSSKLGIEKYRWDVGIE